MSFGFDAQGSLVVTPLNAGADRALNIPWQAAQLLLKSCLPSCAELF
jgi:hypothetical protein